MYIYKYRRMQYWWRWGIVLCRPNLSDVNSNRAISGRERNKVTYPPVTLHVCSCIITLCSTVACEKLTVHYNIIMYL